MKIPTQVQTAWVGRTTYPLPPPLVPGSRVVSTLWSRVLLTQMLL
jgi:hypothetical protein